MGRKLIIKGADFSLNAVSKSPNYETVVIGTSKSLWENANTVANTTGYFGFIVPYNCYIVGLELECSETPSGSSYVGIFNEGDSNTSSVQNRQEISVVQGLNSIKLVEPILVKAGQCIAVKNANVYYCNGTTKAGDYPTNNYNGNFAQPPYRCFRMNFIAEKEII